MREPVVHDVTSTECTRTTVMFKRAASFIPSGVAILSAAGVEMTVSSLSCVSYDPPMIAVALSTSSRSGSSILSHGAFKARLLRDGEQGNLENPNLPAMAEFTCEIEAIILAGDHHLVLASLSRITTSRGEPVVYWRRGFHSLRPTYGFLKSRKAFEDFVSDWEAAALPKSHWTHPAHVAVGASYCVRFGSEAFEQMKSRIRAFNESAGIVNNDHSGYHETLTRFWSEILSKLVYRFANPWRAARRAVLELGEDRDLHHLYYSFDVVRSTEARRRWIPPDLKGPY